YLRHPAPSPSRPNDVLNSSVAARSPSRWRDRARVAVTGDSGYGGRRIGPATSGSHGQQLSRGRKVTIRQILVRGPRGVAPPRPGEGSSRGGRPRSGVFHGVGRPVRRGQLEGARIGAAQARSEEHTSELQSRENLVCRLLLEKKKEKKRFAASDAQNMHRQLS